MKFFFTLVGIAATFCASAQWNQLGQNVPGSEEESGYGWRVSISDDGTTIAVGAPFASENGLSFNGRVEVYRLIGNLWTQLGSDIVGPLNEEELGSSVSLSEDGNTLAVARPWANGGNGMVSVYTYTNNAWALLGVPIVGAAGGNGGAVAISNNGLTVAATAGSVCRVYEFDGSNWALVASPSTNQVMQAVAISADGTRVITAGVDWLHSFDKVDGVWSGATNFMLGGDEGTMGGPNFLTMSGDGNFFAKGAESNDEGGFNAGKVIVVDRTNPDSWTFANFTGNGSSEIGKSISLNHDGSVMSVLGTTAQIYERIEETWTLEQTIFGALSSAVAINGAGDVIATGYRQFTDPELGEVGVMRAYGNNPNASPTMVCPENITVNSNAGACGAVVELEAVFATDLEDGNIEAVQTDGPASGSLFPVGMNEVTFTATDSQGLTATCSYTITVTDIEPPAVLCGDVTVQLNEEGIATITLEQVLTQSADNCAIDVESLSQSIFTCDDLGAQSVQVSVSDIHGNQSTCIAEVTVEDVIAPEISCQNVNVQLNDSGQAELLSSQLVNGFSDNCGAEIIQESFTFSCEDLGVQFITLSVTDVAGNISSCISEVTVEDTSAPIVACQNIEVALDALGEAVIAAEEVDLNSSDNCTFSLSLNATMFECANLGTNSITLTGEDAAGNAATCISVVTVVDVTAPELLCPEDYVAMVMINETYTLEDFLVLWETDVNDACTASADIVLTQTPAPGTELDPGDHAVSFSATDASGNESTCSFMVTVEVVNHIVETLPLPFSLHPNPASQFVTIDIPFDGALTLEIYDMIGRKVFQSGLLSNRFIDLSSLESGEYIVRLQGVGIDQVERLVLLK